MKDICRRVLAAILVFSLIADPALAAVTRISGTPLSPSHPAVSLCYQEQSLSAMATFVGYLGRPAPRASIFRSLEPANANRLERVSTFALLIGLAALIFSN